MLFRVLCILYIYTVAGCHVLLSLFLDFISTELFLHAGMAWFGMMHEQQTWLIRVLNILDNISNIYICGLHLSQTNLKRPNWWSFHMKNRMIYLMNALQVQISYFIPNKQLLTLILKCYFNLLLLLQMVVCLHCLYHRDNTKSFRACSHQCNDIIHRF